jgi:hypothetical protein
MSCTPPPPPPPPRRNLQYTSTNFANKLSDTTEMPQKNMEQNMDANVLYFRLLGNICVFKFNN